MIIDGWQMQHEGDFSTKSEAYTLAQFLRRQMYYVKVIADSGGWHVWRSMDNVKDQRRNEVMA